MHKLVILTLCLLGTVVQGENLDFYLLIGQSNMAGRAELNKKTKPLYPAIANGFQLNDKNQWVPATTPLNEFSAIRKKIQVQQLGPGYAFCKKMIEATGKPVGLVVNARGGSKISSWEKGEEYYTTAVTRAKAAQQIGGNLRGILWHQGESDTEKEGYKTTYMNALKQLIADLRAEFGSDDLPFIAGQINNVPEFNNMILELPSLVPNTAVVSSEGLVAFDQWHFNVESQLKLGERYFTKMLELQKNFAGCTYTGPVTAQELPQVSETTAEPEAKTGKKNKKNKAQKDPNKKPATDEEKKAAKAARKALKEANRKK